MCIKVFDLVINYTNILLGLSVLRIIVIIDPTLHVQRPCFTLIRAPHITGISRHINEVSQTSSASFHQAYHYGKGLHRQLIVVPTLVAHPSYVTEVSSLVRG